MPRPLVPGPCETVAAMLLGCALLLLPGCGVSGTGANGGFGSFFTPTDVGIIRHHVRQYQNSLREFTARLYAKNPKYEKDPARQRRKIDAVFAPLPTGEQV